MPKKDNRKPFANRHIGPRLEDIEVMLTTLGYSSMSNFIEDVVPADIRLSSAFSLNGDASGIGRNSQAHIAKSESEALSALKELASQNEVFRSFIGMGYYNCLVPPVIQRNILENPGWYTQYTPYQAEISQGRLEALLNFQTMVIDLTGLPVANASLLRRGNSCCGSNGNVLCKCTAEDQSKLFCVRNLSSTNNRCFTNTR